MLGLGAKKASVLGATELKVSQTTKKKPEPEREYRVIKCNGTGSTILQRFSTQKEADKLCGQLKRGRTKKQISEGLDYYVELNDLA
jgi:hypothetical protein